MVDAMLGKGIAFTANHGSTDVSTSEFGQTELTSKLFSDEILGIKAQDYGDFVKGQGRKIQSILFHDGDYAKSQKGPYTNRLRVYGPVVGFIVIGVRSLGDDRNLGSCDGAFGVRFEKTA